MLRCRLRLLATASFSRAATGSFAAITSNQQRMPDFMKILQQAQEMQGRFQKIQDELAQQTVSGSAGGGMVTADVRGTGQIKKIKIDPSVVNPADVEMLEDLVVVAVSDAQKKAQSSRRTRWGSSRAACHCRSSCPSERFRLVLVGVIACPRSTISRPSCRGFPASAGRRRCGSRTICCASRPIRPSASRRRCSRSVSGCGPAPAASISPRRISARSAAIRAATRRRICVVEQASDIGAIERAGEFRGVYHVLGGRLSPLDGVGPDDLTVRRAGRARRRRRARRFAR